MKKIIYYLAFKSPEGETEVVAFDKEENLMLSIWAFMDIKEFNVPMALSYQVIDL